MTAEITLDALCEVIPDEKRARLDRAGKVSDNQIYFDWCIDGYLHLRNAIPAHLINAYCAAYERDNGAGARISAYSPTQYMKTPEIKDIGLYSPLVEILNDLIGEPVGMNLNLTNWISTERTFHQDDYLNPPEVNGHYLACWFALEDIHPDSGVFQFVPGSHKWPVMRMDKVKECLEPHERNDPDWPRIAERIIDPLYDQEIEKRGAEIKSVDLKKGDVLIWHSWLVHRGSKPKNPDLLRKSLIVHYSGINHRPDMRPPILYENGQSKGRFFPF